MACEARHTTGSASYLWSPSSTVTMLSAPALGEHPGCETSQRSDIGKACRTQRQFLARSLRRSGLAVKDGRRFFICYVDNPYTRVVVLMTTNGRTATTDQRKDSELGRAQRTAQLHCLRDTVCGAPQGTLVAKLVLLKASRRRRNFFRKRGRERGGSRRLD